MKTFQPYLNFDGNTREAMAFYQKCLDAELSVQTFGDANIPGPPGSENRVMHAHLQKGTAVVMASDTMPGQPFTQGTNLHINIDCETVSRSNGSLPRSVKAAPSRCRCRTRSGARASACCAIDSASTGCSIASFRSRPDSNRSRHGTLARLPCRRHRARTPDRTWRSRETSPCCATVASISLQVPTRAMSF